MGQRVTPDCKGGLSSRAGVLLGSAGLLAVVFALSRIPFFLDLFWSNLFPLSSRLLATIFAPVPFSVAEILLIVGVVALVIVSVSIAWSLYRRRLRAALRMAGRLAGGVALLSLAGYLLWGINYAQPELLDRLGWAQPSNPGSPEPLRRVAALVVEATNRAYQETFASSDMGGPSPLTSSLEEVDRSLSAAYAVVADELGLTGAIHARLSPAKPITGSVLMSCLGLTGFYFPWTGEVNFNRDVPAFTIPHTIAHEKAHQRGFTSEAEANFLGFLAAIRSQSSYARYSGYAFAQEQLLREFARVDREEAIRLASRRFPGVARDYSAEREFWDRHRGLGTTVGEQVNDAYLKLHRVEGGVRSYALSSGYLLAFYQQDADFLHR